MQQSGNSLPSGSGGNLELPCVLDSVAVQQWMATEPARPGAGRALSVLNKRIGMLAGHMSVQLNEHQQAIKNTNLIFEQLLEDLPRVCDEFQEAFALRGIPAEQIYHEIDPDRSVGIINILWHTITFTTRGNSKPLALHKAGRQPQFTGRIVAFHGDFHLLNPEGSIECPPSFHDWLQYEVCSLFVPGDTMEPTTFTVKHLGNQPHYFHQMDAARLFLTKTLEMVCGGGFIHEQSAG